MKRPRLEKEEKEILDAIEKGEWEGIKPKKATLKHYAKIAENTFRKDRVKKGYAALRRAI